MLKGFGSGGVAWAMPLTVFSKKLRALYGLGKALAMFLCLFSGRAKWCSRLHLYVNEQTIR